jgi:hypothetical protein
MNTVEIPAPGARLPLAQSATAKEVDGGRRLGGAHCGGGEENGDDGKLAQHKDSFQQWLEWVAHQLEHDVKWPVSRSRHPGPEPPAQTLHVQMKSIAGAGALVAAAVARTRAATAKSFLSMFPPWW